MALGSSKNSIYKYYIIYIYYSLARKTPAVDFA